LEAGQETLKMEQFELNQLITKEKDLYEPLTKQKGILLSSFMDPEVPPHISGDKHKITQVMGNLISNAIKFTSKGSVEIKVKKERDTMVKIEVSDTGIGIKGVDVNKLFNSFTQLDNSMAREHGGTGLGLVISRKLVTLLGGEIGVESKYGIGTTFWFTFPLIAKQQKEDLNNQQPNGVKETPTFKGCVLLVEDNVVNQKVQSMMLSKLGCTVDIACNGLDAYEKFLLNSDRYSIILMDIQMPVLDGVQAAAKIKSLGQKINPPIIGLSANAKEGAAEHYINQGLDDYLSKPVTLLMLSGMLEKWLQKNK